MQWNPFRWSFRAQYVAGFLVCLALLAFAWYVQFDLKIEPCPLCIFQRLAFMAMAVFFLFGALHNPRSIGRRGYSLGVFVGAGTGIGLAAYHLWVQHIGPDPLASCAPGWNWMIETHSLGYAWSKTIEQAFVGHADCAEINWTLFGLAMPFWTLVCYVLLAAGALWAGWRRGR